MRPDPVMIDIMVIKNSNMHMERKYAAADLDVGYTFLTKPACPSPRALEAIEPANPGRVANVI